MCENTIRTNSVWVVSLEQIGLDSGGESADANLGPGVQGPRRMFQAPDSNTPPNTTANRPDQKPVAVTQPVVTQCVAVRNNNSSHESEGISAER